MRTDVTFLPSSMFDVRTLLLVFPSFTMNPMGTQRVYSVNTERERQTALGKEKLGILE